MGTKAFTAKAAHALSNNGWERKSGGWYVRRYNGGIVATLRASGFWEVRGPAGDTRAHGDDIPCEAWMALDANEAAWRQPEYRAYWDSFHARRECVEAWERAAREAAQSWTVISRYHNGTVKRRSRPSLGGAHRLAAWEVDAEGAHTAEIFHGTTTIGAYSWRSGLTYSEAV